MAKPFAREIAAAKAVVKACERKILHETEHTYLNNRFEICLNGVTHAVVIGKVQTIEHAKRVMERLERYPQHLHLLAK